jgi:hypothetical protein
MKKAALGVLLVVACLSLAACVMPYSRTVVNQNLQASGEKVEKVSTGLYILGLWAVSDPDPIPVIMYSLAAERACSKLENVDIDYWMTHYWVVGIPKVKITAACVK